MHVREPSQELRRHLQNEYDFRGGKMKGIAGMNTMRMDAGPRNPERRDSSRYDRGSGGSGANRDRDDGRGRFYQNESFLSFPLCVYRYFIGAVRLETDQEIEK